MEPQAPECLALLFPSQGPGEFAARRFPHEPLVDHGPVSRLKGLSRYARMSPLQLVEESPNKDMLAYVSAGRSRTEQRVVTRASAVRLFKRGCSIDVGRLNKAAGPAREWTRAMERELGLEPGAVFCNGIASPKHSVVPMHFDGLETLIVQMTGRKRWSVARCTQVSFPSDGYFPGVSGDRRSPFAESPSYFPKRFPTQMPRHSRRFLFETGSASFLPRGWWHTTYAVESGISLAFGLLAPHWTDVLLKLVRGLIVQEAWRTPLEVATPKQRADARRRLRAAMGHLRADLTAVDPLLGIPEPRRTGFRVLPGWRMETASARRAARLVGPDGEPMALVLPKEAKEALKWMLVRRSFNAEDVEARWATMGRALLAQCVAQRIIEATS